MSETAANGASSGSAESATAAPGAASLVINAQYLRDLSFENPRAPESLLNQQNVPPEVSVNVDVKARSVGADLYEVVLDLKAETKVGKDVAFIVEVEYGAVVTIRNAAPELLSALILIETPRLLFPFARAILADATRDGGFPPLLINPIDFAELHRHKALQAEQAEQSSQTANA